jgi:hypothetical protein
MDAIAAIPQVSIGRNKVHVRANPVSRGHSATPTVLPSDFVRGMSLSIQANSNHGDHQGKKDRVQGDDGRIPRYWVDEIRHCPVRRLHGGGLRQHAVGNAKVRHRDD